MVQLPMPVAELSLRFRRFADLWCRDESPLYCSLGAAVAEDAALLDLLARCPLPQPTLFFAAAQFLGAPHDSYEAFRVFVLDRASDVLALMQIRRTQTNEVGRCAVLLPALAALPQPLALLEVGASAGLCLLLDRYAYEYEMGESRLTVGDGPVRLRSVARGPVPIPRQLPEVIWRRGLDLAPIDVTDLGAVRWLEACIWPDQPERLERLRAAIALARETPPVVVRGDAITDLWRLVAEAPRHATLVIFHSAVLLYLNAAERQVFAGLVRRTDAVWLANEPTEVLHPGRPMESPAGRFVLSRNDEVLAVTHPHGQWIEWTQACQTCPPPLLRADDVIQ